MLEAITYQNMLKEIKRSELLEDTIGILITRPDLETGKDIINSLGYYHLSRKTVVMPDMRLVNRQIAGLYWIIWV